MPFTLVQGSLDTEVQDIIYDSRKAAPGLAFVCIVGTQRDSHEFAADCAAKGVNVLVIQHEDVYKRQARRVRRPPIS